MTSQLLRALLPVLLFAGVAGGAGGSGHRGGAPSLEFHHRFSAPVRRWADARGHDLPGGWPAPGGAAYVAALAGHDRRLRGSLAAHLLPGERHAEGQQPRILALCACDGGHAGPHLHGGAGHRERPLLASLPVRRVHAAGLGHFRSRDAEVLCRVRRSGSRRVRGVERLPEASEQLLGQQLPRL